ncbi:ATP-binding protein [Candidatus Woesearchaeota archaeon]|nr:ATP-binding protein [Candidatus Woesearchaeota archaeon]
MPDHDYVITSGPGAGKTAVIEALAAMGHATVVEAAREVIRDQQERLHPVLPWTNNYAFQLLCLGTQLAFEAETLGKPRFLDRSHVDSLGYSAFWNNPVPDVVRRAIRAHRYEKVFVLDTMPEAIYRADGERKESYPQALALREHVRAGYREAGYDPIVVPVFPGNRDVGVKLRLELILSHVRT